MTPEVPCAASPPWIGHVPAAFAGPDVGRGLVQVVGEVLGGARLVGPVHRRDGLVRQRLAGVVRGDLRRVPVGDPAVEDAGDGGGRELEVGDPLQVVDHRDRRDVGRDLDDVAAAALLRRGQLLGLEVGVAAGERDAAGEELGPARTGAGGVVVDGRVGVRAREAGDPGLHGGLLGARAGTGDRAAQGGGARARGGATGRSGLVGRAAAREEHAGGDSRHGDSGTGGMPLGLHAEGSSVKAGLRCRAAPGTAA